MTLRSLPPRTPPSAPIDGAPLLVTYEEAARILGGVSTRHVERLVAARELRTVGKSRARRILYASIIAYIEREAGNG